MACLEVTVLHIVTNYQNCIIPYPGKQFLKISSKSVHIFAKVDRNRLITRKSV